MQIAFRCISQAFSHLFCEELKFVDVLIQLKRFYFSESTDWMTTLLDRVFKSVENGLPVNNRIAQSIFEDSIMESTYASSESCQKIRFSFQISPARNEEEALNDISSQQFIDRIRLTTKVDWPLNLILTDPCLENYNGIFQTLLRIRQAQWWLFRLWSRFNEIKRFDISDEFEAKLKQTRLWYQVCRRAEHLFENRTV